jgi:magnesium transporter
MRIHYEQLIDMAQELEENENGFFKEKDLRYLHLFMNRMLRLSDIATSVRDHTTQVRELYQTQLDVRQNRTMTLLTVIATIFMPLTLITGWYGMNFHYMPELEYRWSYPAVFLVCLAIAVGCLVFFKKKKWM